MKPWFAWVNIIANRYTYGMTRKAGLDHIRTPRPNSPKRTKQLSSTLLHIARDSVLRRSDIFTPLPSAVRSGVQFRRAFSALNLLFRPGLNMEVPALSWRRRRRPRAGKGGSSPYRLRAGPRKPEQRLVWCFAKRLRRMANWRSISRSSRAEGPRMHEARAETEALQRRSKSLIRMRSCVHVPGCQ
jgi:hypothetical protein